MPVSSASRIPLMTNGTIDLECVSTTNNLERHKLVAFSPTYFLTANRFVAKTSTGIKTIDLKGKTVASTAGTTNIKQLFEANSSRQLGMTIMTSKDNAEGFLLVETGRADAYVMDDIPRWPRGGCKDPVGLCDFDRRIFHSGALRHHAAAR